MSKAIRTAGLALLVSTAAAAAPAHAVEDFYRNNTISLVVGYSPGGGYDNYARLVARHMSRHIPGNPSIVVQNMPGAGSLVAAQHVYSQGPQDGTVIGTFARGLPFAPMLGIEGADFDPLAFNYIGSPTEEVSVCGFWHESGVDDWEQLREREYFVGGTGSTSDNVQYPTIINSVLGTQMNIITGYGGGNEVNLAMEAGEVDGRCSWSYSSIVSANADWYDEGKINIILQLALNKHADLPDVPLVVDLAETDEDRELLEMVFARQTLAWPLVMGPGVPEDRVEAIRAAFLATVQDPQFLAEAEQARMEINPVSGVEIAELVERIYSNASEDVVARAAAVFQ